MTYLHMKVNDVIMFSRPFNHPIPPDFLDITGMFRIYDCIGLISELDNFFRIPITIFGKLFLFKNIFNNSQTIHANFRNQVIYLNPTSRMIDKINKECQTNNRNSSHDKWPCNRITMINKNKQQQCKNKT